MLYAPCLILLYVVVSVFPRTYERFLRDVMAGDGRW